MNFESTLDPVAIYAAALSTALVLTQLCRWLMSGPRISVIIINPREVRRFDHKLLEVIACNIGATPIIIREVRISYSERRRGAPLESVSFNSRTSWDPSLRSVPHPTKQNSYSPTANVILPGHEHHELIRPFDGFDPTRHWLQVSVALRNSSGRFNGFAAPIKEAAA